MIISIIDYIGETMVNNRKIIITFLTTLLFVSIAVTELRDAHIKKELVTKGLAYYTNDVNGKMVFKLKEIK